MMVRVFLNAKEEKEILQGFLWVFDNEISHVKYQKMEGGEWINAPLKDCDVPDGTIVEVCNKAGGFLGTGVLNKKSKITIRLISSDHMDKVTEDIPSFIDKKIADAVNYRRLYYSDTDSYRLVFAEADMLPGLIVERYVSENGDVYLVVQFLAMACNIFRKEILESLKKHCNPDFIYERADEKINVKEGLDTVSAWIGKTGNEVLTITENEIKIKVDIVNGQKTGYFLDQKFNRKEIQRFCHGKKVLDTFTHTGAFGLNAYKAGAREVTSVDISQEAVDMVNENIRMNNAGDKMTAVCADVFELLKDYENKGEKFDVIILDPPAFTKSAKTIEKAYGGYKEINLRAMRLLVPGGILITCSCSHFFDTETFYDMIMHAAKDSHRRVQIFEKRGAGPDHPVLMGYPTSEYLKCAVTRVL
ncbi:MAG: class I SAM-dependent rRNA methyltransferase [Treponema sp.]|nr:class I SAM-dependent rRNA methyltransferase [Treponema sp.]